MVFGIRSALDRLVKSGGNDPMGAPETIEEADSEDNSDGNDNESSGVSRPPGWAPMYGTYEKPVYPIDDREVAPLIESLDQAADIADFKTHIPPLGTNQEHIELRLYTVTNAEKERTLVIDAYIHSFSEWTPEEKGDYEYPERTLSRNGPYYMHLADAFESLFRVGPFGFEFVEYDEAEDLAIFSAEVAVYRLEEPEE